jgi:hypothetical protein
MRHLHAGDDHPIRWVAEERFKEFHSVNSFANSPILMVRITLIVPSYSYKT